MRWEIAVIGSKNLLKNTQLNMKKKIKIFKAGFRDFKKQEN